MLATIFEGRVGAGGQPGRRAAAAGGAPVAGGARGWGGSSGAGAGAGCPGGRQRGGTGETSPSGCLSSPCTPHPKVPGLTTGAIMVFVGGGNIGGESFLPCMSMHVSRLNTALKYSQIYM